MQMDEMTQQNAALVEEASAASEAILGQATHLAELVASYAVTKDATAAVARQPAREPRAARPTPDRPPRAEATKRAAALRARAATPPAPATTRKVASGGGGDEWDEF